MAISSKISPGSRAGRSVTVTTPHWACWVSLVPLAPSPATFWPCGCLVSSSGGRPGLLAGTGSDCGSLRSGESGQTALKKEKKKRVVIILKIAPNCTSRKKNIYIKGWTEGAARRSNRRDDWQNSLWLEICFSSFTYFIDSISETRQATLGGNVCLFTSKQ